MKHKNKSPKIINKILRNDLQELLETISEDLKSYTNNHLRLIYNTLESFLNEADDDYPIKSNKKGKTKPKIHVNDLTKYCSDFLIECSTINPHVSQAKALKHFRNALDSHDVADMVYWPE